MTRSWQPAARPGVRRPGRRRPFRYAVRCSAPAARPWRLRRRCARYARPRNSRSRPSRRSSADRRARKGEWFWWKSFCAHPPAPTGLNIKRLPAIQDGARIATVFGEHRGRPARIEFLYRRPPSIRVSAGGGRFSTVSLRPAKTAVVRGQGERHAIASRGRGRYALPQVAVVAHQSAQSPRRVVRLAACQIRKHTTDPISGVWSELREAIGVRRSCVMSPPAFLVNLSGKRGDRRIQTPHQAGVARQIVTIPRRHLRDRISCAGRCRHTAGQQEKSADHQR